MLRVLTESSAVLAAPVFLTVLWLTDRRAAREQARDTANGKTLAA